MLKYLDRKLRELIRERLNGDTYFIALQDTCDTLNRHALHIAELSDTLREEQREKAKMAKTILRLSSQLRKEQAHCKHLKTPLERKQHKHRENP